jgi:5-methylcytosine-specific restriction endonuclease McrA
MALNTNPQMQDDILDIKKQSLYARLKTLFSSDTIVRNVGGKKLLVKDVDHSQMATDRNSLRDRFNRIRSTAYNAYTRDFTLSYQAARMDLFRDYDCIAGETIIPLPDGTYPTIAELTEKYKDSPQERFHVFSYDHESDSMKLGNAYHPRKKEGKRVGWKVVFDDGKFVIGSEGHPFLMRNGEYKVIKDLRVGESVMPFYQKDNKIYQPGLNAYREFHYKNCPACKENFGFFDSSPNKFCSLACYANYRSINFRGENCPAYKGNKTVCLSCNVEFLNPNNKKYCSKECMILGETTGPTVLYQNQCKSCGKEYNITPKNKKSKYCSDECRLQVFSTSFKGENHYLYVGGDTWKVKEPYLKSSGWHELREKIREKYQYVCQECAKNEQELNETLSVHHIITPRLFENPLDANNENNLIPLCRKCHVSCPDHVTNTDLLKSNFPKIKHEDSEKIINEVSSYSKFMYEERFMSNIEQNNTFKNEIVSKLNHKIVSIECVGEIDVYDVTVEKYQNFATDSVFCHNTMDQDPILSSALDIYSDECVTMNELGKIVTVHCEDNNIKEILYNLYEEILHVDFNLWSWTRNLVKYGDFYLKTYVNPEYGVYMVEPISTYNVERIENSDPYNKKYVKFQIRPTDTSQAEVLERYQMSHFRLLSDSNFIPYGKSVIEGARRVWKQLSLLEDAMMIHRVVRAPERRIYYTDIGGIAPAEVDNHMQRLMDKMRKVPYVDERTGEYNLKFNLQNMLDDLFIPVRGGDSGTKIDTLPGMEWTGIDDIDYLKNKMFAALKMPKAFLTFDESTGGKANLSQEDLRFARTIQRIQKIIGSELENIGIIHLYAQGYRDESLIDFKVELTNSSTIFEKEKLEIWSDKTALATDMIDNKIYNREWIYKNVFKMSDDDIEKVTKGLVEDAKQKFRLESIETEGDDPAKPFKKIGAGGHGGEKGSSSGGGGGGGMGGLGGLGGGDEEGEGEGGTPEDEKGESDKQGIPAEEPEEGKPEDIVKEEHSPDRDQSGEHDANDHPFGEDPLGQNELNRKPRKNSEGKRKSVLYHNFENDSPLSLEEVKGQLKPKPSNKKNKGEFIMGLREFFDPTPSTIIAENIIDVTVSPTIDENVKSE